MAVVNPSKEALVRWAKENDIAGDFSSVCENPAAKEYILGELTKIAKEKKVCCLLSLTTCPMSKLLTCND